MVRGRLALLIAYGPEARAFLQSGLAARLLREWEVVIVSARPDSSAFAGRPERVFLMPAKQERLAMQRIRAWGRGMRRRLPAASDVSIQAERLAGRFWGGGGWIRFFRDQAIGAIVAASAAGPRLLPALQAAANLGLPSTVLLNSWKDLYVRGEFPAPVTAAGTVTAEDLVQLARSPGRPALAESCGSLHQAAVRGAAAMQRSKFCGALGLDPARPIVLYATAANDPEEPARLNWLAGRLGAMEGAPQLLIRSNPMDASDRPYRALAAAPGVALLEPKWEWRPEQEWSCPLPEDLPWWRGALEHAALAVTLPSTIALDYAAWGKPAVLLAWGRGASLWGEPGYEAVRRTEGALTAWSPGEAAARIERVLRDPPKLPPQFGDSVGAAVRLAARAFHGALPSAPPVSRPRAVTP